MAPLVVFVKWGEQWHLQCALVETNEKVPPRRARPPHAFAPAPCLLSCLLSCMAVSQQRLAFFPGVQGSQRLGEDSFAWALAPRKVERLPQHKKSSTRLSNQGSGPNITHSTHKPLMGPC